MTDSGLYSNESICRRYKISGKLTKKIPIPVYIANTIGSTFLLSKLGDFIGIPDPPKTIDAPATLTYPASVNALGNDEVESNSVAHIRMTDNAIRRSDTTVIFGAISSTISFYRVWQRPKNNVPIVWG